MATRKLEDIFTEKQLHQVLRQCTGEDCAVLAHSIKPAAEGLTGFLGDHFRVTLHAKVGAGARKFQLFVKSMPMANEAKAQFIDKGNYFRREMLMFDLFRELGGGDGPHPWRPPAYLHSERLLVMPDLAAQGYSSRPSCHTFDLPHTLVTAESVARFHAAYANYATSKTSNGHLYGILDDHAHIMTDPTFCDSPWLRAAGKLSANLIETFSSKYHNIADLENKLVKLYIEACDSFTEHQDTLNVIIHKDLWANNIMFRYEDDTPVNAVLIDFQCLRYGPPGFDLAIFLYLTTSRSFRELHEREVYTHYFSIFSECLDVATRRRLKDLKYGLEEFLGWCDRGRMFGLFMAIGIFPYVLMEPVTAQAHFDDPATFARYCDEDRSAPVLQHCRLSDRYRGRLLDVTEEFVEKYVLELL